MADRKISELTALTTPATGDLIPIVDISEVAAADKNKSITVGELLRGAPDGTAAAPGFAFESDGGNGMFLGGTDILAFSTGGTQAVTIDASQRVGLGTSSAQQKLHVSSADSSATYLRVDNTAGQAMFGVEASGASYAGAETEDAFGLVTNGTYRMYITSAGKVGVGTSTLPANGKLQVAGANATTSIGGTECLSLLDGDANNEFNILNFATSVAGTIARIGAKATTTGSYPNCVGELHFAVQNGASTNTAIVIDASSRVGIGTTSPGSFASGARELVVGSGSAAQGITIFSSTSTLGSIAFADGTTGNEAYRGSIDYNHSNDALTFSTSASSRVVIDSSGRLLVGTSTSRSVDNEKILQIEGTDLQTSSMSLTRNTNSVSPPNIALGKSRGTTIGSNTIVQDGDSLGIIVFCGADGTDLNSIAAGISGQVDGTPGANDMPGRLVFSTTADGASSPTERLRIAQSGAFGLSGANYGSSGQVLTSQGSGSAPQWADAGGGKILQVVSTTKTDTFSTSSSTLTDITGLSVSITPSSSSSKILVVAYINGVIDTGSSSYGGRLQLVRGSTNIAQGDAAGSRQVGTGHLGGQDSWPFFQSTTITYLDSPSTTSSTTYKIQCAHTQSRTIQINTADGDQNSSTFGLRTVSTITVMEVAA